MVNIMITVLLRALNMVKLNSRSWGLQYLKRQIKNQQKEINDIKHYLKQDYALRNQSLSYEAQDKTQNVVGLPF